MIIRCPHCGAGQGVRYQLGQAPGTACCAACGKAFPFFPALEFEIVGQPRTMIGSQSPPRPPGLDVIASPPAPGLPATAAGLGGSPAAVAQQGSEWPLRLAGLLVGILLMTALGAQFLVHERSRIADHPELLALSDALCEHLSCPGPEPRIAAAIDIDALRLQRHAPGRLRVEMVITNTRQRPQPWPLLEMALSDRFGRLLAGARWHPAEYLGPDDGAAGAPRMLVAGEVRRLRLVIGAPDRPVEGISVRPL